MRDTPDRTTEYEAGSLSLIGAVALGTGVMIGAGIFALTGQMAEMTGSLFALTVLSAALFLGENFGLRKALALLLGLAGVTLLAMPAFRGKTGHDLLGASGPRLPRNDTAETGE